MNDVTTSHFDVGGSIILFPSLLLSSVLYEYRKYGNPPDRVCNTALCSTIVSLVQYLFEEYGVTDFIRECREAGAFSTNLF